jgi:tetratricopeptide (TPR) repeat protein
MRRELLISLLLICITLALYGQVLNHQFVYFDDTLYVTENRHIQEGLTLESVIWALTATDISYWQPMTLFSLVLDYEIFGLNPRGFHLTNLLLHTLNALFLFLVLRRMTGSLWQSAFVATLFAIHPLNVESVAWVVERKNVLSTFFWMLTMLSYVYYSERPSLSRYLLTLLLFALGLMAKPMLVTLPFVLLLLDYWPLGRLQLGDLGKNLEPQSHRETQSGSQGSLVFRLVLEKVPFFVFSMGSIYMSLWSVQSPGSVATNTVMMSMSLRFTNALVSYVSYIGKMIWPRNLAVFYPPPEILPWWQAVAAAFFLILVSVLVLRQLRRRPYLLMGWLWYLGTLIPVIGLVQVGLWPALADRFVYVPLVGLFIIAAWGVPDLLGKWRHRKLIITVTAGVLIAAASAVTWAQLHHWRNTITLFQRALKVTSRNYLAHNNLGAALDEQGKIKEAIAHYTKSLEINPNYWMAHNNLGTALAGQGKNKEAIAHYRKALEINPNYAGIHNNFATFLAQQGRIDEALTHFSRALQIRPDFAEVHGNLGNVFGQQGMIDEAVAHYNKALELKPTYAEAHNNLGVLLAKRGRLKEATNHYSEALRFDPQSAETHNNLAVALVELGEVEAAIPHYVRALDLQPDYAMAHNNLGNAFSEQGRLNEAIVSFSKALEIRPNSPVVHNNLGVALARQGNLDEAIVHFSAALRLKPDYIQADTNLRRALEEKGRGTQAPDSISDPKE